MPPHPAPLPASSPPVQTAGARTSRSGGGRAAIHLLLLVATFYTLTLAGAAVEADRLGLEPWRFEEGRALSGEFLLLGLPYSLGVLIILGAHEMGHYVACRYYRVEASLPFFLPSVPFPFGTFGAFIRIRSPIPNRKALFDIGLAGPLAGFAVLIPVLVYGLATAEPVPRHDGLVPVDTPLLYSWFWSFLPPEIGPDETIVLGGALRAAWLGCLATALNLFPIGQLDGGHVCYAVSPRFHRTVSLLSLVGFTGLGLLVFPGWLFMATLLILFNPGHPPLIDEATPLSAGRLFLAGVGLVVLIVCFIARPIAL